MISFDDVFTFEHMMLAGKECCKDVRWKSSTQMFETHMASRVSDLLYKLRSGTYKPAKYKEFDISERGKTRHISSIRIDDRCVQKCLCLFYLRPLIYPKLIYDNSANIPGKGTEFAIKRLKQHLAYHYKKHGRDGGILLLDYHDFFGSILHDTLYAILRKIIEDDRLLDITMQSLQYHPGGIGIGLGSEVSQIMAVFYRNKVDHAVKEKMHIHGYGCYQDDSYLIHEDIGYLKECWQKIIDLSAEYGLTLNEKSKIVRLTDGFVYLKKRFKITDTGKIVVRITRKNIRARRVLIKKFYKKGITDDAPHICWRGYAKHYDTHRTIQNMDRLKEVYTIVDQ